MSGSSTEPVTVNGIALHTRLFGDEHERLGAAELDRFIIAIEKEARTSADARADAAEREVERLVAENRRLTLGISNLVTAGNELARSLNGSPGFDPMRSLLVRHWSQAQVLPPLQASAVEPRDLSISGVVGTTEINGDWRVVKDEADE